MPGKRILALEFSNFSGGAPPPGPHDQMTWYYTTHESGDQYSFWHAVSWSRYCESVVKQVQKRLQVEYNSRVFWEAYWLRWEGVANTMLTDTHLSMLTTVPFTPASH
jgi:hypothetical protein